MLSYRDLVSSLKRLNLGYIQPVIAHASLSSLGELRGGAETVLGALLTTIDALMLPTFTYKTMIIPEVGPEDNAIRYSSGRDANCMAEIFHKDMPADKSLGVVAETLRRHPHAYRSSHPILSFAGVNVGSALEAQTRQEPLAPVRRLFEDDGVVLLLGVDHTVNTAIHYAELLAGQKQFVRWALTRAGVVECPAFPGCSNSFEQAAPWLEGITRRTQIGNALARAIPLRGMVGIIVDRLRNDPFALLCQDPACGCCAVRRRCGVPHAGG
ncbi:MAG: AAC(3) family N-acetyltransferase [Anaerolineaceae bacterium]|nr:AAC(3) family N-acetyltransferase [Anaerolineaceae bacterium]